MSDLWSWVIKAQADLAKQGHTRLAEIVERLPSEIVENRHARADAMATEGIALARSLDLPWIEVFLRHWHLQSRVLHRMEGESALAACVDLVDFAHRPETAACPQAVCAVQDLGACYGFVDGPGYCDERLAVAEETLARIDPSWPCFSCISSEKAGALRYKLGPAAALEFLDEQVAKMALAGQRRPIHDMPRERAETLIDLGRLEEALAFFDLGDREGRRDSHNVVHRRIDRARVLVRLGRVDEAKKALPPIAEIEGTPLYYEAYADALKHLAKAGAIENGWQLGKTIRSMMLRLRAQGVLRTSLELAELDGQLAVSRGASHVARRSLAVMEGIAARLNRPLDARLRVAELRSSIEVAPDSIEHASRVEAARDPNGAAELRAAVEAGADDPEDLLATLDVARASLPDEPEFALASARVLQQLDMADEAIALFEAFHEAHPDADGIALELGHLLRERHADRFRAFVASLEARGNAGLAAWLEATDAMERGRADEAIEKVARVIEIKPASINARVLWARAARIKGDFATALAKLDEAIELGLPPGPADWDRMVAATMTGAWDRVRDSAKRAGKEIPGEGPIDESWGLCRVRLDDDERTRDAYAIRTSPVTARIIEMATPPHRQRYGEVVVFDAAPLNPPPASDEERREHVWIYPLVAILRASDHAVFFVDGVHPGEEKIESLRTAVVDAGAVFRVLSGDAYRIDVRSGDPKAGLYAGVAIPKSVEAVVVHRAIAEATKSFAEPLTWAELAAAAGDVDLAEQHRAIGRELGL